MRPDDKIVWRTCTGCRRRDAKPNLLRVVRERGRAVADPRCRRAGRGAYVHPARACVEAALRRGGLARALRGSVAADAEALVSAAAEARSLRCAPAEAGPYDPRAASARVVKGQ